MKNSGIKEIDNQKDILLLRSIELIDHSDSLQGIELKKKAVELKKDITIFRIGLGASRKTEFYEGRYEWTDKFNEIIQKLDIIINFNVDD